MARLGYWYPQAGRLIEHPGHHNLAWEISADPRFNPRQGTLDDLLREVRGRDEDIFLSSEDFECALHDRARFAGAISRLQAGGMNMRVVLYVRPQSDYLARMYLTLLRFGMELTFDAVLESVLNQGELRWRGQVFNFDYADLLARLEGLDRVEVAVRSYDRASSSICADFLSVFNLSLADVALTEELVANPSLPLRDCLRIFLCNRRRRVLLPHEEIAMDRLFTPPTRGIHLSPGATDRVVARFLAGNHSLFLRYGIPEPEVDAPTGAPGDRAAPFVDQLFSGRTEAHVLTARAR